MKKTIAIILLLAVSISLLVCRDHKDNTAEAYTNKTPMEQMISELFKCFFLDIFGISANNFDLDDEIALGEIIDDCQIEKDKNGVEFKRTYIPFKNVEMTCELVKNKNAMKISCRLGDIECEYNETGKLIYCTTSSGVTYEFSYGDNGKCKGSTITNEKEGYVTERFYGVKGPFASRTYNANDDVIEIIKYGNDGSKERTKYLTDWYYIEEYDCDGNLLKTTSYADDGSITEWEESEYDENGNKTKWLVYAADGSITKREESEYDEDGNKTKWLVYAADGSITKWEESEYDEDGNKTRWLICASDGSIAEWKEYEHDEEGNETKCSEYASDSSLTGWEEYEYDGVIKKTTVYGSDGRIITEYDDAVMWLFTSVLTLGLISPAVLEALDNADFMPDASESAMLYLFVYAILEGA